MTKMREELYIHPAGWPFIAVASTITLGLALFGGVAFMIGLILTSWVVYFFRNPVRVTPKRPGLIVAPADGRVCAISTIVPDEDLGLGSEPHTRISIFLNVFNVHINRSAAAGEVAYTHYRPGKFFNASLDKASVDNERNALALTLSGDHAYAGKKIGIVQIAGLIARRIVCTTKIGDKLKAGQRFGLIRFGSRTDVYLPQGIAPLVCVGQTMIGGETIVADCAGNEKARDGEAS